ncbi:S41 family peptidase [Streptomyces sp. NPDC051173]|uniref:S41 family peptidase n=1 Tax=Streptomyces sp. NPDC051173 TaxID=3155164 RepID=UPI00344D33FD
MLGQAMAPEARSYLTAALDIMEKRALVRRDVDWARLRRTAFARAGKARTPGQTYDAIRAALETLGDGHSRFLEPGQVKADADAPLTPAGAPHGRLLPGGIGYLALPPVNSARNAPAYIRQGRAAVSDVDRAGADRWVVDLRDNTGGNMWAPLAVVGVILGDGDVGAFVAADGVREPWTITGGTPQYYATSPGPAEPLSHPGPAVAVLTGPDTASAAEAVAIAFRGRSASRSFGQPTAGVPTGNVTHALADGALIALTEAREADRAGRVQYGAVVPDEGVPGQASGAVQDRTLDASVSWLAAQLPSPADKSVRR